VFPRVEGEKGRKRGPGFTGGSGKGRGFVDSQKKTERVNTLAKKDKKSLGRKDNPHDGNFGGKRPLSGKGNSRRPAHPKKERPKADEDTGGKSSNWG